MTKGKVNRVAYGIAFMSYVKFQRAFIVSNMCDATETGGTPPVTTTNDTTPLPWRRQAALV